MSFFFEFITFDKGSEHVFEHDIHKNAPNTSTLYSKKIEEQKAFYRNLLGLTMLSSSKHSVSFKVGGSVLEFVKNEQATPYHFAINIPSNQEHEALSWLKAKTTLLKNGDSGLIDFTNWNAKAMYFYDADKNIVEFIARKNLNINSTQPFSAESLLSVSEIGIPTQNIKNIYKHLNSVCNLPIYYGELERFCAIGDEHGLFICINQNTKDWFPAGDKAHPSCFKATLVNENNTYNLTYIDSLLTITSIQK